MFFSASLAFVSLLSLSKFVVNSAPVVRLIYLHPTPSLADDD